MCPLTLAVAGVLTSPPPRGDEVAENFDVKAILHHVLRT